MVDKFRNIHIYECDLNAVLAIKWKSAIFNAEKAKQLCESQFGSRQEKTSQIPILLEVLQQDISRVTRNPYGQINYDAKACYDRILPNLASAVSDAYGVSSNIVKLHHHLLRNMNYVVTVAGSQKEWSFYNTMNHPVYGTGQGSGNSPQIWTMISSILLKVLNAGAAGAEYITKNKSQIKLVSTAYVDDVNTHHTTTKGDYQDLLSNMSQDYYKWKDILETSGGTLAPEKCSYYAFGWEFSRGGKPEMIDLDISQYQFTHPQLIAKQITASESHRSLGHNISPKEPSTSQRKQLLEVEDRFIGILQTNKLTLKENEVLYCSIYTPTVRYILQGSCMNNKDIIQISCKSKQFFLQKMAYSKTTASKIVYGSPDLGGIGLLNLHTEQGLLNT